MKWIMISAVPVSDGEKELIAVTWALVWVTGFVGIVTLVSVLLMIHQDHELVIALRNLISALRPGRRNGTVQALSDEIEDTDNTV
jgi:hypothetical protein